MSFDPKEEAAVRKLMTFMSPADEDADILVKVDGLIDEWHAREQRLSELERKMARAPDKEGKIDAILDHAENLRTGQDVLKLSPRDIMAATGVTRRYAYDLIDDLPQEEEWFLTSTEVKQSQWGNAEIDNDKKCLGVDFEGVHSEGVPVNRFTTDPSETPASEATTEEER